MLHCPATNAGTKPLLGHSPAPGLPHPQTHLSPFLLPLEEGISLPHNQPSSGGCYILGHAIGKATGSCHPLSPLLVGFPVLTPAMGPSASPLFSEGKHELPYVPSESLTARKNCFQNKTKKKATQNML